MCPKKQGLVLAYVIGKKACQNDLYGNSDLEQQIKIKNNNNYYVDPIGTKKLFFVPLTSYFSNISKMYIISLKTNF